MPHNLPPFSTDSWLFANAMETSAINDGTSYIKDKYAGLHCSFFYIPTQADTDSFISSMYIDKRLVLIDSELDYFGYTWYVFMEESLAIENGL